MVTYAKGLYTPVFQRYLSWCYLLPTWYRMPRKTILVSTSTFPRWSGDHEPPFVYELSRRLAQEFRVIILAPHSQGAQYYEQQDELEIVRYPYCLTRWEQLAYEGGITSKLRQNRLRYLLVPWFLLGQWLALRKHIKRYDVACVHAHWLFPQGWIAQWLCGQQKQVPRLISTAHGGDLYGLQGAAFRRIKLQVAQCSQALTVVSHAMRDYLVALGARRENIHVISMGVDLKNTFTPDPSTSRINHRLLFVGRLVEKKGLRYLLAALAIVLKRIPDCSLQIVGQGPELAALKAYCTDLQINSQVQFLGSVSNQALPVLYRQSSVFVAPSIVAEGGDQEGLGLVYAEALGCECAVVATDLPAIRDIVIHNQTGMVVKQKAVDALADAIITLLQDEPLRRKLGKRGREYALQHFDWEVIATRYASLIHTVIDKQ